LAYGSGYSSQATSSALFSSPLSHKPTREKGIYPSHRSPHSRSKLRGSGPSFGIKKDKEAFDSANADQQDIANEGIKRLLNIEE
jgi:hypothetical protein